MARLIRFDTSWGFDFSYAPGDSRRGAPPIDVWSQSLCDHITRGAGVCQK